MCRVELVLVGNSVHGLKTLPDFSVENQNRELYDSCRLFDYRQLILVNRKIRVNNRDIEVKVGNALQGK